MICDSKMAGVGEHLYSKLLLFAFYADWAHQNYIFKVVLSVIQKPPYVFTEVLVKISVHEDFEDQHIHDLFSFFDFLRLTRTED